MNALAPSLRTEPRRLRFSLADVDLLVARGVIADNARIELIDGDLIEMASEGGPHVDYKVALNEWLVVNRPREWLVAPDATLRLSDDNAPEPDLYVYPRYLKAAEVRGQDVALVIEIADTTQTYDLQRKAVLYASFDVREYWVVDLKARRTHVHTSPGLAGYGEVRVLGYAESLTPAAIPGLALRLSDLEPSQSHQT